MSAIGAPNNPSETANYAFNPFPDEITTKIASHLSSADRLSALSTSIDMRNLLQKKPEDKAALFVEHFGALAKHEKGRLAEIAAFYNHSLKLEIPNEPFVLKFKDGLPFIEKATEDLDKDLSCWDLMCKKYRQYRGEEGVDADTSKKLKEVFDGHVKVVQEFEKGTPLFIDATKDLEAYPDLADKVTRMSIIENEQKIYAKIIEKSRVSLDLHPVLEVAFAIVSYFHSFIEPALKDLPSAYALGTTVNEFQRARKIHLGERTISFGDGQLDVKIESSFFRWEGRYINIVRAADNKSIGYLNVQLHSGIERCSGRADIKDFKNPYSILAETRIDEDGAGRFRDMPVLKLLTQIAVEIFARQAAQKLEVDSIYNNAAHYAVSGFEGSTSSKALQAIREDVFEARKNNFLYPPYEDYSGLTVELRKFDLPEPVEGASGGTRTKFYSAQISQEDLQKRLNEEVLPDIEYFDKAVVVDDAEVSDNKIVQTQRTWEEYIEYHRPVLPKGTRSILPRIFSNIWG